MARQLLPPTVGQVGPKDEDLRKSLLKFIGDFANWDNAANGRFPESQVRELVTILKKIKETLRTRLTCRSAAVQTRTL